MASTQPDEAGAQRLVVQAREGWAERKGGERVLVGWPPLLTLLFCTTASKAQAEGAENPPPSRAMPGSCLEATGKGANPGWGTVEAVRKLRSPRCKKQ